MFKLRRLPNDSERLERQLLLLERDAAANEQLPWQCVLIAETLRALPPRDFATLPPTNTELERLLLDETLLDIMREQADGPWLIHAAHAQRSVLMQNQGSALARLDPSTHAFNAFTEPRDAQQNLATKGADMTSERSPERQWDVVISYAGKDREFVRKVAARIEHEGLKIFFAEMPEARGYLWGKELALELPQIYRDKADYCLVFVSEAYVASRFTKLEFKTALSRALEDDDYVKPIRLDDAELPGLSKTVSYLDARPGRLFSDPARLAPVIVEALKSRGEFVRDRAAAALDEMPAMKGITVTEYFDTVLPSGLRWKAENAMKIDGSVLWDIRGEESGVWLLRLAPPEPKVIKIDPSHDMRELALPKHLRIKITSTAMRRMLDGSFDGRKELIEGNVELEGDLKLLTPVGAFMQGKEVVQQRVT